MSDSLKTERTYGRDPDEPYDFDETSVAVSNVIYDVEAPVEHDGRAETRTTFIPSDADDVRKFQTLREEQEQCSGSESRNTDQKRRVGAWASALLLTDYQRERVRHHLDEININEHGRDVETVGLALITLVTNEDDRALRRETEFHDIRDTLEVTTSNLNTARNSLRKIVLN